VNGLFPCFWYFIDLLCSLWYVSVRLLFAVAEVMKELWLPFPLLQPAPVFSWVFYCSSSHNISPRSRLLSWSLFFFPILGLLFSQFPPFFFSLSPLLVPSVLPFSSLFVRLLCFFEKKPGEPKSALSFFFLVPLLLWFLLPVIPLLFWVYFSVFVPLYVFFSVFGFFLFFPSPRPFILWLL
jgi:hypothetical protein